jgi:hypothetical protein
MCGSLTHKHKVFSALVQLLYKKKAIFTAQNRACFFLLQIVEEKDE